MKMKKLINKWMKSEAYTEYCLNMARMYNYTSFFFSSPTLAYFISHTPFCWTIGTVISSCMESLKLRIRKAYVIPNVESQRPTFSEIPTSRMPP